MLNLFQNFINIADIEINHIVLSSLKDVKSDDPEKLIKHGIAIFFNLLEW